MLDRMFPERPGTFPVPHAAAALVVEVEPLTAIRQVLSLSIHDVVNDARHKATVLDFYRLARRIECESWLPRALADIVSPLPQPGLPRAETPALGPDS